MSRDPHFKRGKEDPEYRTENVALVEGLLRNRKYEMPHEIRESLDYALNHNGRRTRGERKPMIVKESEDLVKVGEVEAEMVKIMLRFVRERRPEDMHPTLDVKIRHLDSNDLHVQTFHIKSIVVDESRQISYTSNIPMEVTGSFIPESQRRNLIININQNYIPTIWGAAHKVAEGLHVALVDTGLGLQREDAKVILDSHSGYAGVITLNFENDTDVMLSSRKKKDRY